MPKFACNVCCTGFPDSPSLVKHFAAEHATTKCHLCKREASKSGNFCSTCRKAFPSEISNLEQERALNEKIENSLVQLRKRISQHELLLRERFLIMQKDLFCSHLIPKDDKCEACERFELKEVRKSNPNIVRINLPERKQKANIIRITL